MERIKKTSKSSKATQVSSGDLITSFIDTITTDASLNTLTGIPSFVLFNKIAEKAEILFNNSKKIKLSVKECILLTFMRLKNAFSYAVLSVLFRHVTATACRNIFHETLTMLSVLLAPAIYWPSVEEIKRNVPQCVDNFQKVRIIVDCIEIPVQTAKSLKRRQTTYSHYKKRHTIKFMTGVTPAGLIVFASKGYGGRYSDKVIFERSGFVEQLEMFGDEVRVDKCFLIRDITNEHFVKPPFLKKQDALLNKNIAKARVHMERVNQRIKTFEILKKPLPIALWPRVDDIFKIICALVNLSSSVLDDGRIIVNK